MASKKNHPSEFATAAREYYEELGVDTAPRTVLEHLQRGGVTIKDEAKALNSLRQLQHRLRHPSGRKLGKRKGASARVAQQVATPAQAPIQPKEPTADVRKPLTDSELLDIIRRAGTDRISALLLKV